jgi:hypothetical protein
MGKLLMEIFKKGNHFAPSPFSSLLLFFFQCLRVSVVSSSLHSF